MCHDVLRFTVAFSVTVYGLGVQGIPRKRNASDTLVTIIAPASTAAAFSCSPPCNCREKFLLRHSGTYDVLNRQLSSVVISSEEGHGVLALLSAFVAVAK